MKLIPGHRPFGVLGAGGGSVPVHPHAGGWHHPNPTQQDGAEPPHGRDMGVSAWGTWVSQGGDMGILGLME